MSEIKWCNYLRESNCVFKLRGDQCKYMHVDAYVEMGNEERARYDVNSLMERHAKDLKELYGREVERVVGARGFQTVADRLVEVGWENRTHAGPEVFFRMVLKLVVFTLHYDLHGAADIMFETLRMVEGFLRANRPPMHQPPALEIPLPPPSVFSTPPTPFSESHDPISPMADSEDNIDEEQVALYLLAI